MTNFGTQLALRRCRAPGVAFTFTSSLATPPYPPQSLHSLRPFSNSQTRRKAGAVTVLTPPPDAPAELAELFSTIRSRIFLPSRLKVAQKRLVFKPRYWGIFRNEEVEVEVGGEKFKLEPLDRTKHIPGSWKSLIKALNLLEPKNVESLSEEGFRAAESLYTKNFVALLQGFREAGRRWHSDKVEELVRKAGAIGLANAIVEAARAGNETGVLLNDVRVLREALWACRQYWRQTDDASRALRRAEQLAAICEQKDHAGGSVAAGRDPRSQVDCIGVLLELAAEHAADEVQDESKASKVAGLARVKAYADRLLTNLELGEDQLSMDAKEAERLGAGHAVAPANYELQRWLPVRRGLELATNLLGGDMPQVTAATRWLDEIAHKVAECRATVEAEGEDKREVWRGWKWAREHDDA